MGYQAYTRMCLRQNPDREGGSFKGADNRFMETIVNLCHDPVQNEQEQRVAKEYISV